MIKCWYCNEELTTANYCEDHIGICTNCYNSMFQGNKIVKGWIDKISDLEAKLAESEEKLKLSEDLRDVEETEYSEDIGKTNSALFRKCQQVSRLIKENNQLKQQLAEKEAELDDKNFCKDFADLYSENKLLRSCIKQHNQDKISFCIEKLEKVKEWCENHKFSDEYDYVIAYEPDEEDASGCVDYLKDCIDNQIEELKKEMK